jgi:glycosyltransferase involved in cell wall biosynthesis
VGGARILVLSTDPVTERMPGPAIRAWHLAESLAGDHEVLLASTVACTRHHSGFATRRVEPADLGALEAWMDVLVAPAGVLHIWPELVHSEKVVVFDLYDPYHLENLASDTDDGSPEREAHLALLSEGINDHLRRGDFFLCASPRQRDFWLGSLTALGRVNARTYADSADLSRLVAVVPFGISSAPPRRDPGALRRRFDAIGPDDRVVLWAGGIYNWFDPLSLLRAVDRLRARRQDVRLVFLGAGHPNPAIPRMRMADETRRLADSLGLTGTTVVFNEDWVPYDDRDVLLTDADLGVSTHLEHAETRYSFRTRVLDYLWASLPMVLTAGDVLSEAVEAAGLGSAVPPGDVAALADAIDAMLGRTVAPDRFAAMQERLRWDRVVEPLVSFCADPSPAGDLASRRPPVASSPPPLMPPTTRPGLRYAVGGVRRRARELAGRRRDSTGPGGRLDE